MTPASNSYPKQFRAESESMAPPSKSGPEPRSRDGSPPRWEYKCALLNRDGNLSHFAGGSDIALDSLGSEGWELVAVSAQPLDQAMFYFRRPLAW